MRKFLIHPSHSSVGLVTEPSVLSKARSEERAAASNSLYFIGNLRRRCINLEIYIYIYIYVCAYTLASAHALVSPLKTETTQVASCI